MKNGEATKIGRTPLFDKAPKNSVYSYRLSLDGKEEVTQGKESLCGLEWRDPLIEKVPILSNLIPNFVTQIAPKYNPLNLVKGGNLECASVVRARFDSESTISRLCRRLVIIPPTSSSGKLSKLISQEWEQRVFDRNKNECDELVSTKVGKDFLSYLGLHHLSKGYGLKFLNFETLAKIGEKLDVTDIVFLHHVERGKEVFVEPKVYDIHLRIRREDKFEERLEINNLENERLTLDRHLANFFQLIPNSLAFKFRFIQNKHLRNKTTEQRDKSKISSFSFPPSLRLTTIEKPISNWGLNFRFSPSLSYGNKDEDYHVRFFSAVIAMKLFGHTPLGSFIGRFGFGGAQTHMKNDLTGFNKNKFVPILQWGVEYYQFLTDRLYFTLGYRRTNFQGDELNDRDFHLKAYSSYFVNLAWYVPELSVKAKKFLWD